MLFRLFNAVLTRGHVMVELLDRGHGVVVALGPFSEEDLVDHIIPVQRIFQRQPDIRIVERRDPGVHVKGEMAQARHALHPEIGAALDHRDIADVEILNEINLARQQRIQARRCIGDVDEFDLVEVGLVVLVIVRIAQEAGRDARLKAFNREGPGAAARFHINAATLNRRIDRQVIIRQEIGQIGIAISQGDDDRVRATDVDFLDLLDDGPRARGGIGFHMMFKRLAHIFRIKAFAIVEGHARAQLKVPDLRAGLCLPAFRKIAGNRTIGQDLDQVVIDAAIEGSAGPAGRPGARIKIVILRGIVQPQPHEAPGLWLGRLGAPGARDRGHGAGGQQR